MYIARSALPADVPAIHQLVTHYANMGQLLPRSHEEIADQLHNFEVIDLNGVVVGCGSLEYFTPELAEIRSLMVDQNHTGQGLGRQLVERFMAKGKAAGAKRIMALTYAAEFFCQLGFEVVDKAIFPEKVWGICVNCYKFNHCDEIAVLYSIGPAQD